MAVNITITDAGRAEVINASNTGTQAVTITAIGLGTGQYTPSADQTALRHPFKQLDTVAGQVVSPDIIHVTLRDQSDDAYTVSEFGLFTDKGTLFAVYSLPDQSLMEKSAASTLLLSVDIELGTLDTANITFGDTSFANPPASETVPGVAELATQEETNNGTDDQRIVTPKKLKAAVSRFVPPASEATAGKARIATQEETDSGNNDQLIVTPKKLKSSLATQVPTASTTTAGKVELATVAEAKSGTDRKRGVTPEGMKAAVNAWITQATETTAGKAEIATQEETDAGTDDQHIVTPKKLKQTLNNAAVGDLIITTGNKARPGTLKANGAAISRTAYAKLYEFAKASGNMAASEDSKQSGQYGPGDGENTFTVPDLRAVFIRSADDGRGVDADRTIGSWQDDEFREHDHSVSALNGGQGHGSNTPTVTQYGSGRTGVKGGSETRPVNIAYLYCIKF